MKIENPELLFWRTSLRFQLFHCLYGNYSLVGGFWRVTGMQVNYGILLIISGGPKATPLKTHFSLWPQNCKHPPQRGWALLQTEANNNLAMDSITSVINKTWFPFKLIMCQVLRSQYNSCIVPACCRLKCILVTAALYNPIVWWQLLWLAINSFCMGAPLAVRKPQELLSAPRHYPAQTGTSARGSGC